MKNKEFIEYEDSLAEEYNKPQELDPEIVRLSALDYPEEMRDKWNSKEKYVPQLTKFTNKIKKYVGRS